MNNIPPVSLVKSFRLLRRPRRLFRKVRPIVKTRLTGLPLSLSGARPIVMFHIGRSGSTVLTDLIDQHPQIFWDGEIYERLFKAWERNGHQPGAHKWSFDPAQYLHRQMPRAGEKFYGFEIKFFHLKLTGIKLAHYIDRLDELGFCYFIVLKRKNYLRKIVSSLIARKKLQPHQVHHHRAELTPVRIEVDNLQIDRDAKPLLVYLQNYHQNFQKLDRLLWGRRVLRLTYEDDILADPVAGYRRVCRFLRLDRYDDISIRYGKINPFKLTEMILNFDEVAGTLAGTSFEWMLRE